MEESRVGHSPKREGFKLKNFGQKVKNYFLQFLIIIENNKGENNLWIKKLLINIYRDIQ